MCNKLHSESIYPTLPCLEQPIRDHMLMEYVDAHSKGWAILAGPS